MEVLLSCGPCGTLPAHETNVKEFKRWRRMANGVVFKGYVPGAIGRVAEMHALYYHREWDFGMFFEAKVARVGRDKRTQSASAIGNLGVCRCHPEPRGPACHTKPIGAIGDCRLGICGGGEPRMSNKANLARHAAKNGGWARKQSQSGRLGIRGGGSWERCGAECQTKPIWAGNGAAIGDWRLSIGDWGRWGAGNGKRTQSGGGGEIASLRSQ